MCVVFEPEIARAFSTMTHLDTFEVMLYIGRAKCNKSAARSLMTEALSLGHVDTVSGYWMWENPIHHTWRPDGLDIDYKMTWAEDEDYRWEYQHRDGPLLSTSLFTNPIEPPEIPTSGTWSHRGNDGDIVTKLDNKYHLLWLPLEAKHGSSRASFAMKQVHRKK